MTALDKIANLKYSGKSKISLLKAVLFFYVIVASNYTRDLYSGQLDDFITKNRYAQHIIAYIMMLILIINVAGVTDIYQANIYSLIAYAWFILTTKLDLHWSLIIISLLIVGFLYESTLTDKEKRAKKDEALETIDRKRINKKHIKKRTAIWILIVLITIIGTVNYANKKYVQYGGGFDLTKFLLNSRN